MRKTILFAAVGLVLCMTSKSAFADDEKKDVKEITFEDDRIEGELLAPNGSNVKIKEMDELSSLIKSREDFVDEMLKSVEDI